MQKQILLVLSIILVLNSLSAQIKSNWSPIAGIGLGKTIPREAWTGFVQWETRNLAPIFFPEIFAGIERNSADFNLAAVLTYKKLGFKPNKDEDFFTSESLYSTNYLGAKTSLGYAFFHNISAVGSLGLYKSFGKSDCRLCDELSRYPENSELYTLKGPSKVFIQFGLGAEYEILPEMSVYVNYDIPILPKNYFTYQSMGSSNGEYRIQTLSFGLIYRMSKP